MKWMTKGPRRTITKIQSSTYVDGKKIEEAGLSDGEHGRVSGRLR